MTISSPHGDNGPSDDLFAWACRQPQAVASALIVDFTAWRARSPRWILEIRPRGETLAAKLLKLDRRAGIEPLPPVVEFPRRA